MMNGRKINNHTIKAHLHPRTTKNRIGAMPSPFQVFFRKSKVDFKYDRPKMEEEIPEVKAKVSKRKASN